MGGEGSWEDAISLRNSDPMIQHHLGPVSDYLDLDDGQVQWQTLTSETLEAIVERDKAPLPDTADREGYYGPNHFNYWASGFSDFRTMQNWFSDQHVPLRDYLDMGCASGRVIRHAAAQTYNLNVFGCDINRQHVDWCNEFLPQGIEVFQNTSLPQIAMPDASLDLISAFSVFTHIEAYDTAWLMEIKRILRPGGVAWLTIHGDRTWHEVNPNWPLYAPLTTHPSYAKHKDSQEIPEKRLVYRWLSAASYSANVFYRYEYIYKHWGRFFEVQQIFPCVPPFQDVVVLRKH